MADKQNLVYPHVPGYTPTQWELNEEQRLLHPVVPLSWGHILGGLASEAANGYFLGAPNLIPAVSREASNFEAQYPVAANAAWFAGMLPDLAANLTGRAIAAGGKLLFRGSESAVPRAVQAIASGIGRAGDTLASLSPARQADRVAQTVVDSLPLVRRSTVVAPALLSGALQGGATAYNYSNDPNLLHTALTGAGLGAALSGGASVGAKYAVPVLGSILRSGGVSQNNAIQKVLDSSGMSSEDFLKKISQLGNNARVYDANPTTLGAAGLLKSTASSSGKLLDDVRNNAIKDIDNIVNDSQGLTERHLGPSLPTSLSDYKNTASNIRSQAADPLYDVSRDTPVDLSSHPDLLNHYVLNDDFKNYLTNQLGNRSDPSRVVRINRFLNNRNSVVNAGDELLRGVKDAPINDADLHNLYGNTINNHIAQNNLDLSLPTSVVQDYIDHVTATRPPISQQYTRLTNNPVNDASRLADTTSRAVQEVSPEFAAAQRTFRELSPPLNQADLARNLTQMGDTGSKEVVNKLDSEVTREFIDRNNQLREAAKAANLPDNSRPLTRYVLDEAINNVVQRNSQKYPQAILDTINNQVEPRLNAVFGKEPVSNLVNDATNNAQYLANRTNLANLGLGTGKDDGLGLEFVHRISPLIRTAIGIGTRAIRSANAGNNRAVVDFLQRDPEAAKAAIANYLNQHPSGSLSSYGKYLSSILGGISGKIVGNQ